MTHSYETRAGNDRRRMRTPVPVVQGRQRIDRNGGRAWQPPIRLGATDGSAVSVPSARLDSPLAHGASRRLNCGIFGTAHRNFRRTARLRTAREQKPCENCVGLVDFPGASLALHAAEDLVFPAAVLSMVLAIGPNAAVLCAVWCHPPETTSAACQHQGATTSPLVTGEDSCRTVPAAGTAFVREEARRGWQSDGTTQSVPVPPFRFAPSPTDTNVPNNASTSLAVRSPSRLVALRI